MPEESDEGEDGGLGLDKAEFKKFIKLAKGKALPFAFCPASGDEEALFTMHRRRKPEVLGKAARKESDQSKFAFGTIKTEGDTLVISATRSLPGFEKKMKKLLRELKIPMKIKINGEDSGEAVA